MCIVRKFGWILALLFTVTACEEKEYLYSDPTDFVAFNETNALFSVVDDKEKNEIEITVSSPIVSSVEREYIIGITLTGADGEAVENKHYKLPSNTVVIPAGERIGSFKVIGIPDYLSSEEDMFVNFALVSASVGEIANFNNVFTLYLARVCEFKMDEMPGTYEIESSSVVASGEKITFEVVRGQGSNELLLLQPYAPGVDLTIKIVQDITGAYTVVMDDQLLAIGKNGSSELIRRWARGTGTWNTCTKIMKLVLSPHQEGNGVEYMPVTEIIKKVE